MSLSNTYIPAPLSDLIFRDDSPLPPYATQDVVTQSGTIQPPCHTESPPTESSGGLGLPLDHLLNLPEYTSDEEMEETTPVNTSTTPTAPSSVSRRARAHCLWDGCQAEFGRWAYESIWENHIRSAHVKQENEGGNRRSKMINCEWDGCTRKMRPQHIVEHIKKKHLETVEDPTSSDSEGASKPGISP